MTDEERKEFYRQITYNINKTLRNLVIVPHGDGVKFVKHIFNQEDEEPVEYFDQPPTDGELTHHKFLLAYPLPPTLSWDPEIKIGNPSNLKISCSIKKWYLAEPS